MHTESERLFLREPGWQIGQKVGSLREFCYMTAPGQEYYHRLDDGEIFVQRGEERLCIPCARRRGLLTYEPRGLRDPVGPVLLDPGPSSGSQIHELAEGWEG